MARGKNKRTVIQVKTATATNVVNNLVVIPPETSRNVQHFQMLPQLLDVVPLWTENSTNATDGHDGALATQRESPDDYVAGMIQITPGRDDNEYRREGEFIEVNMETEGMLDHNAGKTIDGNQTEDNVRKSKKKNKRKKNKKTVDKVEPVVQESCIQDGRAVRLEPINKGVNTIGIGPNSATTLAPKPVGCFGIISTWLAKRKEKRREKKRKAINARKTLNAEPLVEYEHRRAKGGVAFTVELDNRPIMKSVLPPIKQTPGPIRMAIGEKLEQAKNKRAEQINNRRENARAHSRMVQEVSDRRIEKEMQFKQTTLLKIKDKEFKASRAPSRLEYDRNMRCRSRCNSRMRHTPDMFTSKMKITLSSSPVAEVDEMPIFSPLSLADVPLPQYFTRQDVTHSADE